MRNFDRIKNMTIDEISNQIAYRICVHEDDVTDISFNKNFIEIKKWLNKDAKRVTLKDIFLEKMPNAIIDVDNIPIACAHEVGLISKDDCGEISCTDCWNRIWEGEDK